MRHMHPVGLAPILLRSMDSMASLFNRCRLHVVLPDNSPDANLASRISRGVEEAGRSRIGDRGSTRPTAQTARPSNTGQASIITTAHPFHPGSRFQ